MTVSAIHPTAIVDPSSVVDDVEVGAFSVIGPGVRIGPGSVIGSQCAIGVDGPMEPLVIGSGATIRGHSTLYRGSKIGKGLETGHNVVIRESSEIGDHLRVGTNCDLQGHARIGNCVRLHSGVQVNHGSTIADFAWLFPYVLLTNDPHPPSDGATEGPTIERYAVVSARSLILPGITIGEGSLVAAGSTVTKDVPARRIVMGSPARDVGEVERVRWRDERAGTPYPWWTHFRRGYPESVVWGEEGPSYASGH